MYGDYSDRVAVLGIAASPIDDENSIRQYAQRQGYTWDMAVFDTDVSRTYGINQHASGVAIDGSGVITFKKGYRDGSLSTREWREILDEVTGG